MAIFRVSLPGLAPLTFSRDQINNYSSEFNCNEVESEVGSPDFIEAFADLIVEEAPDEFSDYIEENFSEKELMQYVEIIE